MTSETRPSGNRATGPQRGQWQVAGASCRGAAHVRKGIVNQDSYASSLLGGREAVGFIVAVADGHGAASHFRSERGSQFAVQAAIASLGILNQTSTGETFLGDDMEHGDDWEDWVDDDPVDDAPLTAGDVGPLEHLIDTQLLATNPSVLVANILQSWREQVWRDAQLDPVDPEQIAQHGYDPRDPHSLLAAYGTTLVVAAGTASALIVLQIGDGDCMIGLTDGTILKPVEDDPDLVGEETYSLCSVDAPERFRCAIIEGRTLSSPIDFVMASTDGVSKSFADAEAFEQVAEKTRASLQDKGLTMVGEGMPDWLWEVSSRGSGDDTTICIGHFETQVARLPWPVPQDIDTATTQPRSVPLEEPSSAPQQSIAAAAEGAETPGDDTVLIRTEQGRSQGRPAPLSRK